MCIFCKMLFALPLLLDRHIPVAFEILEKRVKTPAMSTLMQYVSKKPYLACEELVHVPRSLQDHQRCRGWHRRINSKAGRTTLQFYMLVPLLHQEAQHVNTTAKLLSPNKQRRTITPAICQ